MSDPTMSPVDEITARKRRLYRWYLVLKILLVSGGPLTTLAGAVGVDGGRVDRILTAGGAVLTIMGGILFAADEGDHNVIARAQSIEGVQKIKIDPQTDNQAALAAAASPDLPKVKIG